MNAAGRTYVQSSCLNTSSKKGTPAIMPLIAYCQVTNSSREGLAFYKVYLRRKMPCRRCFRLTLLSRFQISLIDCIQPFLLWWSTSLHTSSSSTQKRSDKTYSTLPQQSGLRHLLTYNKPTIIKARGVFFQPFCY